MIKEELKHKIAALKHSMELSNARIDRLLEVDVPITVWIRQKSPSPIDIEREFYKDCFDKCLQLEEELKALEESNRDNI